MSKNTKIKKKIPVAFILIKLARFVSAREQRYLKEDIQGILPGYATVKDDPWGAQRRILVELYKKDSPKDIVKKIKAFNGVLGVVHFLDGFFEKSTASLKELVLLIQKFLQVYKIEKFVSLEFKAIGSLPFHQKSLKDRLRKKSIKVIKSPDDNIFQAYLELKEMNNRVSARVGRNFPRSTESLHSSHVDLVLFSPFTTQEIADFFRLALVFNLKVFLTNENKKVHELVEETSKTLFKGISKIEYEIIPSLRKLLDQETNNNYLGFSLWASQNERDFLKNLKGNRTSSKWSFIFGNEDRGLPLEAQKRIQIYRLGTTGSEPLRSSQAAAYALGLLASSSI